MRKFTEEIATDLDTLFMFPPVVQAQIIAQASARLRELAAVNAEAAAIMRGIEAGRRPSDKALRITRRMEPNR